MNLSTAPREICSRLNSRGLCRFFGSEPPRCAFHCAVGRTVSSRVLYRCSCFPVFIRLADSRVRRCRGMSSRLQGFVSSSAKGCGPRTRGLLLGHGEVVRGTRGGGRTVSGLLRGLGREHGLSCAFIFIPRKCRPSCSRESCCSVSRRSIRVVSRCTRVFGGRKCDCRGCVDKLSSTPGVLGDFTGKSVRVLLSVGYLSRNISVPHTRRTVFYSDANGPHRFIRQHKHILEGDGSGRGTGV